MGLIFLSILSLFLIEGIGVGREYIRFFYLLIPSILSLYLLFKNKEVKLPKITSKFFIIYILMNLASIFFSVDKQNSIEAALFSVSGFLIYIFAYNFKKEFKKYLVLLLLVCSILFILVSFLGSFWPYFLTFQTNGYQFIRSFFGLHNHLGDFLGLIIVYLATGSNFIYLIPILPFFLLSYSRSSFLAVSVTLIIFWIKNKKFKLIFLILSVIIFWFFAQNVKIFPKLDTVIQTFNQTELTKSNDIFSGRTEYFNQAIRSVFEKPFFGFGPGNFSYASSKNRNLPGNWTDSAHNIFLEEIVNTGLLGFLAFSSFVFLNIKKAKKDSPFFYIFLYLLFDFQTDYTYKFYSLFILFMILMGVINEEKETLDKTVSKKLFVGMSLFVLIMVHQIIYSRVVFNLYKTEASFLSYPIFKEALRNKSFNWYLKLYPEDVQVLRTQAKIYEDKGELKKALDLYEKSYQINRFDSLDLLTTIYSLKTKLEGINVAKSYAGNMLSYFKKTPEWMITDDQKDLIRNFCDKTDPFVCDNYGFSKFKYFYEPDQKNHKKILTQVPYPESYSINEDTLNERYDYSPQKPKGVFRIIVLGDSTTFGLLVKTKNNWTEKLEDLLNKNTPFKRFEVINLAVNGYDIPFEVERFRKRGVKYDPDLVLWFINNGNFYQLDEIMFEKNKIITSQMKRTGQLEQEISKGNYFSDYEKAYEETTKEVGNGFPSIITSSLKSFRKLYKGKTVVLGPVLNEENISLLINSLSKENTYINQINNLKSLVYLRYGQLNEQGHMMIAQNMLKFLQENNLIKLK